MASDFKQIYSKAWNVALRLLARRSHTERELRRKLGRRGFDRRTCEAVVSACERLKYIDDEVAGKIYLKELIRKGYGPRRIRCSMIEKGIDETVIDKLFAAMKVEESEKEMCRKVLNKKLKIALPKNDSQKEKARIYRFLTSRGFKSAVVCELIKNCSHK